jgi:hypothetical protein
MGMVKNSKKLYRFFAGSRGYGWIWLDWVFAPNEADTPVTDNKIVRDQPKSRVRFTFITEHSCDLSSALASKKRVRVKVVFS